MAARDIVPVDDYRDRKEDRQAWRTTGVLLQWSFLGVAPGMDSCELHTLCPPSPSDVMCVLRCL
jgi:hypothetical protein